MEAGYGEERAEGKLGKDKDDDDWGGEMEDVLQVGHCGRNTHFRQIHFGVPNFNFKNIYMKFELRDHRRIF